MIDEETQSFIDKYRDALGVQRDLSLQNIENSRRNAYQSIMSNANSAGMMYSNFPERSKIQYDTNVYMPNRIKAQTTYQTGLDKLRNNVVDTLYSIADLRDAAAALKSSNKSAKESARINDAGDYSYLLNGGTQYRNNNGENIRFGTAAKRAGYSSVGDILDYAQSTLRGEGEAGRLNEIWEKAKELGYTGFDYNVGDDYQDYTYNFLDDSQTAFLNSLGLKLY
jgi:hypothetical protein